MTGPEAVAYLHAHQRRSVPGLSRMRALLRALGDPQKQLRFVHVAGTNGKGSTCACIASVLQAAGYRVGLNTSPYLLTFHERIRVDGELISDEALGELTEEVRSAAEPMAEHPTEFELITAVAFLHFLRSRCDLVVLEVGLGGEKDASNVIDAPEAAVITAMGLDHVAQLGGTLADIARAKAGILKPGTAAVSYGGCPEADAVIRQACRERGIPLREVDFSRLTVHALSLDGARFDFAPWRDLTLPLAGAYQVRNAATALTSLEVLADRGWRVPEAAVRRGLAAVRWPGRFEVLRRNPTVLLDGAHNAHGMAAAAESLERLFPGRKLTFVLGILADKDVERMLDRVVPLARRVYTIRPDSPRALPAEALADLLRRRGAEAVSCGSVGEAMDAAAAFAGPEGTVCALGSLYAAAAVRRAAAPEAR